MNKLVVKFPEFRKNMHLYTLDLADNWEDCDLCSDLEERRTQVVHGSGNPEADLLILGEGPGNDEDYEGVPFIGESGGLLNNLLIGSGMTREDVFVDNLVACRPTHDVDGREVIRPPTKIEAANCLPRLHEVIRTIDPILIVTMGKSVLQTLLGDGSITISKARGEVFIIRVPGIYKMIEYPIVASRHPAFIIRNPSSAKNSPKYHLVQDFEFAVEILKLARKCYRGK